MENIYEDIARRTDGDVYIGVVGPVRTGKSTFIKRFMETMVIPSIENVYHRERARDELPQSGSGRTIMTAEPKFVPEDAAQIALADGAAARVRLIDCVGYMVPGAEGQFEDGAERMVQTPWYESEIPMSRAAEEGTRRVIAEHSTIGVVVTTDGSFGDIPRRSYLEAEERVVRELREIGKPFVVLLNSAAPDSAEALALAGELAEKYGVPCLAENCQTLAAADMERVLRSVLYQFPLTCLSLWLPGWVEALEDGCELKTALYAAILEASEGLWTLRDSRAAMEQLCRSPSVSEARVSKLDAGSGAAEAVIELPRALYYETISDLSGFDIADDGDLMELLRSLRDVKAEYDSVREALEQARECGYGVVMPTAAQLRLAQPQIVSRGGRYSVRLRASAPAIHLFCTEVETEVSPAVGGERASEEIVSFLLQGFDGDVNQLWESNIFGRSLNDIAEEGLTAKLRRMPPNVRNRLRNTVQRLVNDGGCGLICIIL